MWWDILYIATAGVYWTTWQSPTKCHIQRVINMNSHGLGMFQSVLIICFHFSLKCYFISKVLDVSGSACLIKCYSYIKMIKKLYSTVQSWTPDLQVSDTAISHVIIILCWETNFHHYSWFQTFPVFWMLYAFFWVIPQHLNFICQCFGTLCLFHLHRWVGTRLWRWNRVFWNVGI